MKRSIGVQKDSVTAKKYLANPDPSIEIIEIGDYIIISSKEDAEKDLPDQK